jgi:DNA polymerase III epsilon subunit-like protein
MTNLRSRVFCLGLSLVAVLAVASARAEVSPELRLQALRGLRQQIGTLKAPTDRGLTPGARTQLRAFLATRYPGVTPDRTLTKKQLTENPDATFRGTHPMFKRLVASGWFASGKIAGLQTLANDLRATRALPSTTPLSQVEILAFDLESSGGSPGRFDKARNRVLSGWGEVTQFGYTIYRGSAKVSSGTISIRPDGNIPFVVQRITGLTAEKLATAPRFEQVAEQILKLMQGRVLVGQSSLKNDWSWLQSNFARLGVNLPGPQSLMLDTHVLSFHRYPAGTGLKELSQRYGVALTQQHNAGSDAAATGDVLQAMLREHNVRTLGDAFALQARGQELMHKPH